MTITLDELETLEAQDGPDAAIAAAMTVSANALDTKSAPRLAAVFAGLGLAAEASRVIAGGRVPINALSEIPALLENLAASGNGHLAARLGVFGQITRDPSRYLSSLGGGALRCALQVAPSTPKTSGLSDFAGLLARGALFEVSEASGQMIVALTASLSGTATAEAMVARESKRAGRPAPIWGAATLARLAPARMGQIARQLENVPRDRLFPERSAVMRVGTGRFRELLGAVSAEEARERGMVLPDLSTATLTAGLRAARDRAAKLWNEAEDGTLIGGYRRAVADLGANLERPVLVLSTGRAGTRALETLAARSENLAAFHFLGRHQEIGDLNRLYHGYLDGTPDPGMIEEGFVRFLRDRLLELLWCAAHRVRPVIVNHLDLVQAPFYLALCPDMDIVHVHRDPAKVLISHAYKKQFNYAQIRPVHRRTDPETGLFEMARPAELSHEDTVCWFMSATERGARAIATLTADGRYREIDMDKIFGGDAKEVARLLAAFDAPDLNLDLAREVFGEKINEKTHYEVPAALRDTDRARDILKSFQATLPDY